MSKMFSEPGVRIALNGPTMGTRWQALYWADAGHDSAPVRGALQAAVDAVDAQMSLWVPGSALNRLNAAAPGDWVDLPAETMAVLARALEIGRASGGAFDIAVGAAVAAWGFGPDAPDPEAVQAELSRRDKPRALDLLELDADNRRARKAGPARFDLNGIAKGYGTDRLAEAARGLGIEALLVGIDGELRALGHRPDGSAWPVAIEAPDYDRREAHSVLELSEVAVATSGDYRHWVEVGDARLSHTMNPEVGAPLVAPPASVTVLAPRCIDADAWASALMVLGRAAGAPLARAKGIEALFLERDGAGEVTASWA